MNVERQNIRISADPKKVILQFFEMNEKRKLNIIDRVQSLDEKTVKENLEKVYAEFSHRHRDFEEKINENYERVKKSIINHDSLTRERRLLIGSYFSKEYSIEAAALFNPSIVPHPVQNDADEGSLKFVMSLRATGEGHISSIEFREGLISPEGEVSFINDSSFSVSPVKKDYSEEELLNGKLKYTDGGDEERKDILLSNYKSSFDDNSKLAERVLFPNSPSESMGLEDARFVRFNENGDVKYYGTYTAYNGKSFRTQIIETTDFKNFEVGTLHGPMIHDKGMALFPRKVNGKYMMSSRQDGENLYLMQSDDLYSWNKSELLLKPGESWSFVQLGNCGSPIETDKGWLLIIHAVGPFRKYVIGAVLLDLENPAKIIGALSEPLIQPNEYEREGYVPNVVYSCGSLIHNNILVIPYAMSDSSCGFAKVKIDELLIELS